jgi:hypothetical protein
MTVADYCMCSESPACMSSPLARLRESSSHELQAASKPYWTVVFDRVSSFDHLRRQTPSLLCCGSLAAAERRLYLRTRRLDEACEVRHKVKTYKRV